MNGASDPIGAVKVLSKMKNSTEASRLIEMAANAVRGVLRNRGWKVGTVTEFYPKNGNLLGLNVNHGQVIKLRLRAAHNPDVFLEYHDILGTMVHEVTHIKISPHDQSFYKLMDELYDEVEGVTNFPFPGGANVLGGGKPAGKPSKDLIREAALSRLQKGVLFAGSGQKLGGTEAGGKAPKLTPAQLRARALDAAEKRLRDSWRERNVVVEEEAALAEGDESEVEVIDVRTLHEQRGSLHTGDRSKGVHSAGRCAECAVTPSLMRRNYGCPCCEAASQDANGTSGSSYINSSTSSNRNRKRDAVKMESLGEGVIDLTSLGSPVEDACACGSFGSSAASLGAGMSAATATSSRKRQKIPPSREGLNVTRELIEINSDSDQN